MLHLFHHKSRGGLRECYLLLNNDLMKAMSQLCLRGILAEPEGNNCFNITTCPLAIIWKKMVDRVF